MEVRAESYERHKLIVLFNVLCECVWLVMCVMCVAYAWGGGGREGGGGDLVPTMSGCMCAKREARG